jgi:hypothetical protein
VEATCGYDYLVGSRDCLRLRRSSPPSFKLGRFFWASRSCNHEKRRHLAMTIPNWLDERCSQN